jgi:hypothetical protein
MAADIEGEDTLTKALACAIDPCSPTVTKYSNCLSVNRKAMA